MRISIFLFFISIQATGIFSEVKIAFGGELQVTLENEVAGITPGMKLLPKVKGNLKEPAFQREKPENISATYYHQSRSLPKKSGFKLPHALYMRAGFISKKISPVGKVAKIFDNKLATSGPEKVFIDLGRKRGLEVGGKFIVYSQEKFINHPILGQKTNFWSFQSKTRKSGFGPDQIWSPQGKPLGYRTDIRGVLEVSEVGETFSYATVVKSFEDIKSIAG